MSWRGPRRDGPWLAVASFVNPHDIAFNGVAWEQLLGYGPVDDDTLPDIPEPPSQSDTFVGRPACQEAFLAAWPSMLYEQSADDAYRRLYYHLHSLVDRAIGRILEALEASGMAEDTVIVFTSDHGDLVGAHGGLMQKWYNAYDEAIRVPLLVKGPGVAATQAGVGVPTSHVDIVPTLLGLAGIDVERAADEVALAARRDPASARAGPQRRRHGRRGGRVSVAEPLYFMTEDDVGRGLTTTNMFTGDAVRTGSVPFACRVGHHRAADGPRRAARAVEAEPLLRAARRIRRRARASRPTPSPRPPAESDWELHNLTADPEERHNRASDERDVFGNLQGVLEAQRDAKRRVPHLRNRPA